LGIAYGSLLSRHSKIGRFSFRGAMYNRIFNGIGKDLRASLRMFRRYPGVTALALISLALGIGANTLAFSFVNVLLFRSLPYPNVEQLVMTDDGITSTECQALLDHREIFEDVGCFSGAPGGASIADDNPAALVPEQSSGQRSTAGLGQALAVRPLFGRWLTEDDESGANGSVVVITNSLWQRRFTGQSFSDQHIRINGEAAAIIGVMPDEFMLLSPTVDYWVPLRNQTETSALAAVGRLRREVTIEQAQSALDAIVVRTNEGDLSKSRQRRVVLTRMGVYAQEQYRDSALVLQGTVGFVLLIACSNVAGLLLTQAVSQQRELAVRAALGSGTWRIVRQVMIHSVCLFCAGGLLGLAVGWAGVRLMVNVVMPAAVSTYGEPRGGVPAGLFEAGIDGTVLAFTFVVSILCGLVAAVVPALQTSHAEPLDVLREVTSSTTSGIVRQRFRSVLVTMQIALAFVLLVGAALMINGLTRALNQNAGFDMNDLLAVHVRLPESTAGPSAGMAFNTERMRENLAGVAGVTSATGIAVYSPLSGAVNVSLKVEGSALSEQRSQFIPILPEYFKTLGVRVLQGREFSPRDTSDNPPVAVINDAAARRFFPNENPLGKQIQIQSMQLTGEPLRQVIGVVTEVAQYSFQEGRPQLYVPYSQIGTINDDQLNAQLRAMTFITRTRRPPAEMATLFASAVSAADRNQAISAVRTMEQTAHAGPSRRRIFVELVGLFGAIAVILAVAGVYGVMSNVVSQRFTEFGIRIALGARPSEIRRLVIRRGSVLIGSGLVAGIIVSLAMTRVLRSFLFGASATDPLTFVVGILLLGGVAFLACYIPAWRASRIDALGALRHY